MWRFEDLDRFIAEQEGLVRNAGNAVQRSLENERKRHDPIIRDAFNLLGEYYKEILQPRTDLAVVLKKKEDPTQDPQRLGKVYYEYIANFIPTTSLPYRDYERPDYATPDAITGRDWYPNVALQFDVRLYDKYDIEKKVYTGLEPRFSIGVWGIVPKDQALLTKPGLYLSYSNLWYRDCSILTVLNNENNPSETLGNISSALTIATPNILLHKKHVGG